MTVSSWRLLFLSGGLFFALPFVAQAATLSLSPTEATTAVGTTFTETIFVSSADQAMNAISGTLSFPPELVEVVSVSKTGSILSLWVQDPTFSNTDGTISFSGVVPNPGYTGDRGRVMSVQFRAKKTGITPIVFSSSSQVLANDGNGTNILTDTSAASITITGETAPAAPSVATNPDLLARITSSSHPDQTQWYKLSHAIFDWTNAQGVSAVRLGYDTNASGKPTVVYTDPISHKEFDLSDGVWYFYVQEKGLSGWGPVSTYRVQIDTVPPQPFSITFLNGTTTAKVGNTIPVQFTTHDELSGIDHYQVVIDRKETMVSAEEGSKPYAISSDFGAHTLLVRAYDKAGNVTDSGEETFSVVEATTESTVFTFGWLALNYFSLLLIILAILITLLFGAWYIKVHFSAYRRRINRQLGLTEAHIHKTFDVLKDAITEEILKLEQAKSARELTREEERMITRFKKLLEQSEKDLEKEIEEIPR